MNSDENANQTRIVLPLVIFAMSATTRPLHKLRARLNCAVVSYMQLKCSPNKSMH